MTIDRDLTHALRAIRSADRQRTNQSQRKALRPELAARVAFQRAERERVTGNVEVRHRPKKGTPQ